MNPIVINSNNNVLKFKYYPESFSALFNSGTEGDLSITARTYNDWSSIKSELETQFNNILTNIVKSRTILTVTLNSENKIVINTNSSYLLKIYAKINGSSCANVLGIPQWSDVTMTTSDSGATYKCTLPQPLSFNSTLKLDHTAEND
jgi:hypothetical protein